MHMKYRLENITEWTHALLDLNCKNKDSSIKMTVMNKSQISVELWNRHFEISGI
jgi:hypothetical protein